MVIPARGVMFPGEGDAAGDAGCAGDGEGTTTLGTLGAGLGDVDVPFAAVLLPSVAFGGALGAPCTTPPELLPVVVPAGVVVDGAGAAPASKLWRPRQTLAAAPAAAALQVCCLQAESRPQPAVQRQVRLP